MSTQRNDARVQRLRETAQKSAVPYFDIPSIDGRDDRFAVEDVKAYRASVDSVLSKARGSRRGHE